MRARVPRTSCDASCLTELLECNCGAWVEAGKGHPSCATYRWFGYWFCACGHCTRHHGGLWDSGDVAGWACDFCDCMDSQVPEVDK